MQVASGLPQEADVKMVIAFFSSGPTADLWPALDLVLGIPRNCLL
jgi:hypothetical protein